MVTKKQGEMKGEDKKELYDVTSVMCPHTTTNTVYLLKVGRKNKVW